MDAMSKELETWNLTFGMVLATLINLMWRKYFSVLLFPQVVNVICKFLRLQGGIMTSFPLTSIDKSRKQNPKLGCVTERHLRKQNLDKNPEYWS